MVERRRFWVCNVKNRPRGNGIVEIERRGGLGRVEAKV